MIDEPVDYREKDTENAPEASEGMGSEETVGDPRRYLPLLQGLYEASHHWPHVLAVPDEEERTSLFWG